ncbi:Outer membrane protein beta-barrel domain-containing protein [Epilithonimonas pallida]|uniref:Outer membrane protein beta-barrel domain-containing protein n=2 Tax=Epilithonimonas pallida TaxID=373671 RepID=A0ABY1R8A8_9FLAO|nr:Outer membrane protein beta-barrel domain-containing protein [Epilithonimonas pallida]
MFYICTKFLNNTRFIVLKMKKELTYTFIVFFCFLSFVKAQRHEIGVQLGMSNLVGDIGRTNYILQKPIGNVSDYGLPFYGGVMYRMNFNPYQTVRLNVGFNNIQFDDRYANENYRRMRKLWGTNSVLSADLLFEYNFLPVNEEQVSMISPYIFVGVSGLYMNSVKAELTISSLTNVQAKYIQDKTFTMGLPFGVGLKYKFNYNWALSGEFTFRPTFSDQVDYSELKESDVKVVKTVYGQDMTNTIVQGFLQQRNIGNPNSKDWINSASIILSYSFGRPPCYCK